MDIATIARVCHEANRALQQAQNDPAIPISKPWNHESDDVRDSAVVGVRGVLDGNTPEESHELWAKTKREQGWTYGPVKDTRALEHPCLVPYADLPPEYRVKDALFVAVVHALVE